MDPGKRQNLRWRKPPTDTLKINFDGSRNALGESRAGYVIRNHGGEVIGRAIDCGDNLVVVVEAKGLLSGLLKARVRGSRKVEIEGDNITVINCVRGDWKPTWEIEILISDIQKCLLLFESSRCSHVFREVNRVADMITHLHPTTFALGLPPTKSSTPSSRGTLSASVIV